MDRFEVSEHYDGQVGREAGRAEGSRGEERTGQSRPACLALIHTPSSTHPPICHRVADNNSYHSSSITNVLCLPLFLVLMLTHTRIHLEASR